MKRFYFPNNLRDKCPQKVSSKSLQNRQNITQDHQKSPQRICERKSCLDDVVTRGATEENVGTETAVVTTGQHLGPRHYYHYHH